MIEVANLLQTRRHFARAVNGRGIGTALCTEGLRKAIEVYDQKTLDKIYPPRSRRGSARDIRSLPLCRKCAQKVGRAA